MTRVQTGLPSMSVSGRAYTVLAWLNFATASPVSPFAQSAAQSTVDLLMSDIRVGGRTAYIASSPGGQSPAGET